MSQKNIEPSGVTKGIVNIIQKSTKNKVNFIKTKTCEYSDKTSIAIDRNDDHRKARKEKQALRAIFYAVGSFVAMLVVLLIARPDLFKFLEYHHVYKSFERLEKFAEGNNVDEHSKNNKEKILGDDLGMQKHEIPKYSSPIKKPG